MDVTLYDATTIDALEWPATEEGRYAKRFLTPLVKNGISHYIDNIQAELYAMTLDSFVFPVVVPHVNGTNSYVCSPYQHYITYGKDNIGIVDNRFLAPLVKQFFNLFGKIGKNLDSVVYVNNWLFAVDLYPDGIRADQIAAIVDALKKRFPDRAIIFRSLTPLTNASLMQDFKQLGFHLVPSRPVFITDGKKKEVFATRIFKSDLRLWKKANYDVVNQLSTADCQALWKLQRLLNVVQHSELQPQFNLRYVQLLVEERLLSFVALKQADTIKGVAGYFQFNGTLSCPFFGFDKEDSDHSAIYRLLSTGLLLEAQKRRVLFNESAGASFYKSVRRAVGCLEFMAVYTSHLRLRQKCAWGLLDAFINRIGSRYMRNY